MVKRTKKPLQKIQKNKKPLLFRRWWLFGRFMFVKGLRATHHSLLTHGNLKIDVFKVLGCGDLKKKIYIYIYMKF